MYNLNRSHPKKLLFFYLVFTLPFCSVSESALQNPMQLKDQIRTALGLAAQGKLIESEALLSQIVAENPKAPVAWLQLGSVRQMQMKYDAALDAYEKAIAFPAVKATALYNAGCIHALQQDTDKALLTLQQATIAGFTDRGQFLSDPDLKSLRQNDRFTGLVPPLLSGPNLFVEPTNVLLELSGENANDEFGWVARRVGDLDNDRITDFVTTAPAFENNTGKIYVYSSRTGKLLFSRTGKTGQRYGNGAAGAGDVNADGVPDVIVGGPAGIEGIADILSGKDGTVLQTFVGPGQGAQFGNRVCSLGDVNLDGHADVVVTATSADGIQARSGRCFVYSGKDGTPLFTLDGELSGDKFGSSVAGSANASFPILAIGAQDAGPQRRGRVYVYHLKEGKPVEAFFIDAEESGREFGQMFLSFPGDLNGDSIPDVYCSDFNDSKAVPDGGRVFVYSGWDGKKLLDIPGTHPGEGLGTSPSDAGDVDGDGIGDLIVGAWQNREQVPSGGKVYLYSSATSKLLASWTCKQYGDTFGFDATGIGDINGDGSIDFLLTSAWSPVLGPKTGRVFIIAGPVLSK
jgi:hypothetical protein